MATGEDLITAVASELERSDLDNGGAEEAVSQRALNRSLRDLLNRHIWSWRALATPITKAAIVGTTVYDLSGDAKIQDIYDIVWDTGSTDSHPLIEKSVGEFGKRWANLAYLGTSRPVHYTRFEQFKFKVAPAPNAANNFQIYYSVQFADITVFTNPITDVPDRLLEVVELGMLYRLYRHLHEFTTSDKFEGKWEKAIEKAKKEDDDNPNISYEIQPAKLGGDSFAGDYWKNPFVG